MNEHLLPIFPLQLVLLPEEVLPLHIFEERYKQMIGECLDENRVFGIVLAENNGIRRIGCTAQIIDVIQKFSDGRMNIATEGKERFRILQTHQDKPYLTAEVEYFSNLPEDSPSSELVENLIREFQATEKDKDTFSESLREQPSRLSFKVAAALQLPLEDKQALLETESTQEQFQNLLRMIEEKKQRVARLSRQQDIISRNGHPKK